MTARRLYPTLLAALALAGCSMAPRYSAPASPVPGTFPGQPAAVSSGKPAAAPSGPAAADLEWKSFYADPRLQRVLDLALANNRDFRVAGLNIEKAAAYYRIQRAALLPTVNAGGSYYRGSVSATTGGMVPGMGLSVGISSWEMDFFGRLNSLRQEALQNYLATEQAQRSSRIALLAQVANGYLTLAGDQESLKLAQATVDSQGSTYDLTQRRFLVGAASEIDARRAQISLESARVDLASYTRTVALDRSNLDLLVGTTVPADLLPENLSGIAPLREDFAVGLPSEVLLSRPDILQAEDQLKAANADIGAARAALFPSITLTTTAGTSGASLNAMFRSGSNYWLIYPQINLPIFDYGSRRAKLKTSKIEREIYVAQYEKAIQTAFKEVRDALAQRDTLRQQRVAQAALAQASEVTYRLTKARYDVGMDSSLSVLDAQRTSNSAEQTLISLRQQELGNLVTLYKVVGGGTRGGKP
ncbi:MAG: efflux transporter outer membrane subunit [Holophaga sp.]|nr:efflux transporter outer membrane subunit [Holophaga sp.]